MMQQQQQQQKQQPDALAKQQADDQAKAQAEQLRQRTASIIANEPNAQALAGGSLTDTGNTNLATLLSGFVGDTYGGPGTRPLTTAQPGSDVSGLVGSGGAGDTQPFGAHPGGGSGVIPSEALHNFMQLLGGGGGQQPSEVVGGTY